MSHYKKYSEHRRARDVAKSRIQGYAEGGEVRRFPVSGTQYDLQRLRSAQGVDSGRISGIPGRASNVVHGPGLNSAGDVKKSWLRRVRGDDLPHAKGGRVTVREAIKKHDDQLHGGKTTKLARGGAALTAGAESGEGRLQLAKRAKLARKH